jgi:hypothetical protein
MRASLGTGWRLTLALLIAVGTALLFSAGLRMPQMREGAGDEVCSAGQHDVPMLSRQQESPKNSARRNETDPVASPPADTFSTVTIHTFAAWRLPPPSTPSRTRTSGGRYARGPPLGLC